MLARNARIWYDADGWMRDVFRLLRLLTCGGMAVPNKRIGVLLSGMDRVYQNEICKGIAKAARERQDDVFFFNGLGIHDSRDSAVHINNEGDGNLFRLPDPAYLDGLIFMLTTVSNPVARRIADRLAASCPNTPLLTMCQPIPGRVDVDFDDERVVRELTGHFITVHGAKNLYFVSGPRGNAVASNRLAAFQAEMRARGLKVENHQVYYGDYTRDSGAMAAQLFLRSGRPLPDAILCANDDMAIGLYEELVSAGVNVPEDVGISGFDATEEALLHAPSITTVKRPLVEAGVTTIALLHDLMDGKTVDERHLMTGQRAVYGRSCGCKSQTEAQYRQYISNLYRHKRELRSNYIRASYFAGSLNGMKTFDEFRSRFHDIVREWQFDEIYVLVSHEETQQDSGPDVYMPENAEPRRVEGYSPVMRLIYGYDHGRLLEEARIPTHQLIPRRASDGTSRQLVCCPLHFQDNNIGYVAFDMAHVTEFIVYSFMLSLSGALETLFLQNTVQNYASALEKMYIHDSLTGLFNRRGYYRFAQSMYEDALRDKLPLMIVCVDIDHLKTINDTYGHHEGDAAIKALAACLGRVAPPNGLCVHLSGDEFMMMAAGCDQSDMQRLLADVQEEIDRTNTVSDKPYGISASAGGFTAVPDGEMSLEYMTSLADDAMYAVKKQHHKMTDALL